MTEFKSRVGQLLEATGVPLNTVLDESMRIEEAPGGFILRWDGGVILTAQQAATLLAPHTGEPDCPACNTADPDGGAPTLYCRATEPTLV